MRIIITLTSIWMFSCIGDKDDTATDEYEETVSYVEYAEMVGMTEAHNAVRRAHGIDADLIWDQELAKVSMQWLEHLKDENGCRMEHNWDSPLGENLMWATYYMDAEDVVDGWASEEAFYDYDTNSCQPGEMCGHYTQIVWEKTERVGCAMITCKDGSEYMWMCNYDPAGNMVGSRPY